MDLDRLFSVAEAAKFLGGISQWTIHAWLSKGRIRRTKVGRRTMIRESELRKMIRDEGNPSTQTNEMVISPSAHRLKQRRKQ